LYKRYRYVFSKKVESCRETSLYVPRSSQVVNIGHASKYISYYQLIMEAEGMKNHGIRIMHDKLALSPVPYMWGFPMEKLQLDLEHLVAMNSLSSNMIYFPI
jgi:hypothetical protein